ncbi:MAG: PEP-CTERM sorting domain-containing protein, partial [Cyanobacteriota bacterium]|nr:PEP-CTERM sorting domain-containing protein [Cyanobacteriota bacterium]
VSEFTTLNLNPQQIPPEPPPEPEPNPNLLPNGSFETGDFTNWETLGNTSITTAAFGRQPTDGLFQALLSTDDPTVATASIENFLGLDIGSLDDLGNGTATFGSAIQQTFTANAGDILSFDWNFLTDEGTPTFFNDFAFVSIISLSELADTTFPDFFSSLSPFNEETGFQSFSFIIPMSGTYSLGIGITDVEDAIVDSGLLIDNVALQTVPEPASIFGLFAFSLFGFRVRLKRKP